MLANTFVEIQVDRSKFAKQLVTMRSDFRDATMEISTLAQRLEASVARVARAFKILPESIKLATIAMREFNKESAKSGRNVTGRRRNSTASAPTAGVKPKTLGTGDIFGRVMLNSVKAQIPTLIRAFKTLTPVIRSTFNGGKSVVKLFASSSGIAIRMFVRAATTSLRALQKLMGVGLRSAAKIGIAAFKGLGIAARGLGAAIGTALGPLKMLAFLLAPLGAALGGLFAAAKAVDVFADFEQAMARVHAITDATAGQFAKLTAQAEQLGRDTVFSATQAAEAMGNFAVAGFKVEEIMGAMPSTLSLAAAGQLDMATSSDIVSKIMRGMGIEVENVGHAVDVLTKAFTTSNTDLIQLGDAFKFVGPNAKAAGAQFEEVTGAIQLFSDAGIQGEMAGTALRNIYLRLINPTKEVTQILEKLNMSLDDGTGKLKPLNQIIDEFNAKTKNMTQMEKQAAAANIAGTRATSAFLTLLANGGETLRWYTQRLEDAAGTADKIAAVQLNTLKGALVLLESALEGAAIAIGRSFKPAMLEIIKALIDATPIIGQVVEQLRPVVTFFGGKVANAIRTATTILKENIAEFRKWGRLIAEIMSNVTNAIGSFITGGLKLLGAAFGAEFKSITQMATGLVQRITALFELMAGATHDPVATFKVIGLSLKAALMDAVGGMLGGIKSMFSEMIGLAWAFARTFTMVIKEAVMAAVPLMREMMDPFSGDAAKKIAADIFDERMFMLQRKIPQMFQDAFASGSGAADKMAGGLIDPIVASMGAAADSARAEAQRLIAKVSEERRQKNSTTFSGAATAGLIAMANAFANTMTLGNKKTASELGEGMKTGFDAAIDGLKRMMGMVPEAFAAAAAANAAAEEASKPSLEGAGVISDFNSWLSDAQKSLFKEHDETDRTVDAVEGVEGEVVTVNKNLGKLIDVVKKPLQAVFGP